MVGDDDSLLDLYSPDDVVAKARADAMAQRARGLQGAGLILSSLTGKRDPTQGALGEMGTRDLATATQAVQHRPAMLVQAGQARRALEEENAWKDPNAGPLLRGAIRTFMPSMEVDENTPVPVLRNFLPVAEKYGQSLQAATIKAGTAHGKPSVINWTDPNTGHVMHFIVMPDGSRWDFNGNMLSPPLPTGGGHGASPAAPGVPHAPGSAAAVPGGAASPAVAPTPAPRLGAPTAPGAGGGSTSVFPKMMGRPLGQALEKLGKDFDPNQPGGEIQKNQGRLNAANRLLALAETPDGKPADLNPQQMPELSQALASLIAGGGAGTVSQIEHLTPKTMSGDWAKVAQWLTNEPHGAGQQAFVQNMIETAKRERDVAQKAIGSAVLGRQGKHQRVLRGNPDESRAALEPLGWTLDDKGAVVPFNAKAHPTPDDAAAIEWLKANPNHKAAAGVAAKLKAKGLL